MSTVLAVDPGSRNLGWAVVRKNKGITILVDCGTILLAKDIGEGVEGAYRELGIIGKHHRVQALAMESVFFNKNITSALKVSEIRGCIRLLCRHRTWPVTEYTPQRIKKAITGSGNADKTLVMSTLNVIFERGEGTKWPSDHAADAAGAGWILLNSPSLE